MQYKYRSIGIVINIIELGTGEIVPADPSATSYQTFLKHISEGGSVLPADPPPKPAYLSKLTIVDRITDKGNDPNAIPYINKAITMLSQDAIAKLRWDAAAEIATNDMQVWTMIAAIGLDPNEILAL